MGFSIGFIYITDLFDGFYKKNLLGVVPYAGDFGRKIPKPSKSFPLRWFFAQNSTINKKALSNDQASK